MQNELEILRLLNVLVTDVSELKGDVKVLKEDVSVLKEDVSVLKEDVNVLKEDVNVLKGKVNVLTEDVNMLKGKVNVLTEDVNMLKGNVEHLLKVTARMEFDFNNKIDSLFAAYDVNENIHKVLSNQISDLTQKFNDQRNRLIALELRPQTN